MKFYQWQYIHIKYCFLQNVLLSCVVVHPVPRTSGTKLEPRPV